MSNCCFDSCASIIINDNELLLLHLRRDANLLERPYIMLLDNRSQGLYKVKSLVNSITGIAKNSGTEGDTIKVIVPE